MHVDWLIVASQHSASHASTADLMEGRAVIITSSGTSMSLF